MNRPVAGPPVGGFRPVPDWEQPPAGCTRSEVSDVAIDPQGHVHVLVRDPSQVLVYAPNGTYLRSWGAGVLSARPHGITASPDGERLYVVDQGADAIWVFDPDGERLGVIGAPGQPSDTGADWSLSDSRRRVLTIREEGGPPFNGPTRLAVGPDGDLFVADGYGNARVHRLSPEGELLDSWGGRGAAPGRFHLPHGIAVAPDGRVVVTDRENDRVQVLSPEGEPLAVWDDVRLPAAVAVDAHGRAYLAELPVPVGRDSLAHPPPEVPVPARVTVRDLDGTVLAEVGLAGELGEPGVLVAPHGIAVGPDGSVVVGELTGAVIAARAQAGTPLEHPERCPWVQRFTPET